MTKTELKQNVTATGSHYFDRGTMQFFGDTMANYRVPSVPVLVTTSSGDDTPCYALERIRPVKHGLQTTKYFDADTFKVLHPAHDLN